MRKPKSDYDYVVKKDEFLLAIVDKNLGGMSVTNNIENVVDEIANVEQINPEDYQIVYRDSQGEWDGWNHKTQEFIFLSGDFNYLFHE